MNLVWQLWLPLGIAGLTGPLGLLAVWSHHATVKRLGALVQCNTPSTTFLGTYRQAVARTPVGHWLRKRLDKAGIAWDEGDILAGILVTWFVGYYAAKSLLALQQFGAMVVAVGVVALASHFLLAAKRGWHSRRFNEQLPEIAWILSNALRAGMTLQQAIALLAKEVAKPARQVFQRVMDEIDLSRPIEEVLQASTRLVQSQEYSLMVTILLIQYRAGGDLAAALEDLSHTLQERKSVQEEVQSATSGAKMTAAILPFMPLLCTVVLNMAIPGALNVLFTLWGMVLLAGFLFLQWCAYITIRRMADIKV